MMTKMREMTFVFIWILVIAFVGLMVLEWGMDITGLKSRSNIVGKIDGNKITIQQFQEAVQNYYLQERERTGQDPDEEQLTQIRDQVWDQYIQRVLFSREIEKRNIKVTDQEVFQMIAQNPQGLPPAISENPNFLTDGQFDMAKYRQALENPQIDWSPIENYVREIMPFQKLQNIITASVMVTEQEVREDYLDKNQKASILYLNIPVSAFTQDSIQTSEKEIRDFYNSHKEEFKIEERRKINYVQFSTTPSAADSQKVFNLALELKAEAAAGTDFAQLADEYSEDPSAKTNHGDLGYFERERMVKEFSDAAFAGKPGEIVGPVKTTFGLHLIKIQDRKIEEGIEKVSASHILLKYTASASTVETAQDLAANFSEIAQEDGFKITADQYRYEVKTTAEFMNRNYIPGLGQMVAATEWTFNADKEDVSRVFRTAQGYVVLEVAEILPAGYRPLEEVKELCKNRLEQQKRKEIARIYAQGIQEKLNHGETFQAIAAGDPSRKVLLDSTAQFSKSQNIPKIGRVPEVAAAAFTLEPGITSSLLESERGFYFIRVLERTAVDEEDYQAQKENIRLRLLNQRSQQFFNQWYEKLKEKADIEDNRNLFFAT
jgi:peptidyl-prolyl cis-trans isomerase D